MAKSFLSIILQVFTNPKIQTLLRHLTSPACPQPIPEPVLLRPIVNNNFSTNQRVYIEWKISAIWIIESSSDETALISPIAKLDPLSTTSKSSSKWNENFHPSTHCDGIHFTLKHLQRTGITYGRTLKISLQSESDPNKMNAQEKAGIYS